MKVKSTPLTRQSQANNTADVLSKGLKSNQSVLTNTKHVTTYTVYLISWAALRHSLATPAFIMFFFSFHLSPNLPSKLQLLLTRTYKEIIQFDSLTNPY